MYKNNRINKQGTILSLVLLGVLVLSSCAPATAPTVPPPGPTLEPNVPVAILPTSAAGEPAATARYDVSIYGGPGTNYALYSTLRSGTNVKVTGKSEDGQWWGISIPIAPTGIGWVETTWVTVSNAEDVPVLPTPPVPPTTEMIPPGPSDPQAVVIANVYVRTGPGTNYPAYGLARTGVTGRVIGKSEDGEWWVVRLDPTKVGAGYGWLNGSYTQETNVENVQTIETPPVPKSIAPPAPPNGVAIATTVDYVNIRSGPGTNYPILAVASPGVTGQVTGKSSDGAWWQVKVPNEVSADGLGWVSAEWVIAQNTGSVPVVAAPPPPSVPATPPSSSGGCVVSQTPSDGTVFEAGTSFTTTWVLQNNSSSKWSDGEVDLRYVGAAANVPLHQGQDIYDLSNKVEPGWTYNFSVPMIAPFEPGTYGEVWEVGQGSKVLCQFYVYIEVR